MDSVLQYSTHPAFLFFAIIVIAWIWEDAALIAAALLAADTKLSVPAALISVFVGICSGDLALYYLGRLAHRWRTIRAWVLTNPKSRAVARRFRRHTISNIIIIRFIPGLRTIGFTACGLWRVSLERFISAMIVAALIWITLTFSLVYFLGSSEFFVNSHWKWSLMGIALFLLIFNNFWNFRSGKRKEHDGISR